MAGGRGVLLRWLASGLAAVLALGGCSARPAPAEQGLDGAMAVFVAQTEFGPYLMSVTGEGNLRHGRRVEGLLGGSPISARVVALPRGWLLAWTATPGVTRYARLLPPAFEPEELGLTADSGAFAVTGDTLLVAEANGSAGRLRRHSITTDRPGPSSDLTFRSVAVAAAGDTVLAVGADLDGAAPYALITGAERALGRVEGAQGGVPGIVGDRALLTLPGASAVVLVSGAVQRPVAEPRRPRLLVAVGDRAVVTSETEDGAPRLTVLNAGGWKTEAEIALRRREPIRDLVALAGDRVLVLQSTTVTVATLPDGATTVIEVPGTVLSER